jgi:hypothetical protein
MLALSIAHQTFKTIPGRNLQLLELHHGIQQLEFPGGNRPQVPGCLRGNAIEDVFSSFVFEANNHAKDSSMDVMLWQDSGSWKA